MVRSDSARTHLERQGLLILATIVRAVGFQDRSAAWDIRAYGRGEFLHQLFSGLHY
jgi:hypothetical protein